ncbi:Kelch domain-containing protein 2 [Halotydeus destructor]|nr:Kelch domain-containing protein 2 [Halotydeus destructor]
MSRRFSIQFDLNGNRIGSNNSPSRYEANDYEDYLSTTRRFGQFEVRRRMTHSKECEPGKRIGHVSVYYKGSLVVWGGYNDEQTHRYLPSDQIWIYDPLGESWSTRKCVERLLPVKDMPPGTSGACAAMLASHMYIFGGYTDDGNTNSLYRVNLAPLGLQVTDADQLVPQVTFEKIRPDNMEMAPTSCDKNVCWSYKGKLYIFGGYGLEPAFGVRGNMPSDFSFLRDTASHWHYQRGWNNQLVCYDPANNKWSYPAYKGKSPCPRAAHAMSQIGAKVYIHGGRSGTDRLGDLWELDMLSLEWTQLKQASHEVAPPGRSWHSLTGMAPDELVLFGGLSNSCEPMKDCWTYSTVTNQWTQVSLPSEARLWHTAVYSPEEAEVLIYGGGTQNILNYRLSNVYTNDLITLRFKPKSLLRLALDTCVRQSKQLQSAYCELPRHLHRLVDHRRAAQSPKIQMLGS